MRTASFPKILKRFVRCEFFSTTAYSIPSFPPNTNHPFVRHRVFTRNIIVYLFLLSCLNFTKDFWPSPLKVSKKDSSVKSLQPSTSLTRSLEKLLLLSSFSPYILIFSLTSNFTARCIFAWPYLERKKKRIICLKNRPFNLNTATMYVIMVFAREKHKFEIS